MPAPLISPPNFHVPIGACDCHVHVFLPKHFAFDPGRKYTPPAATMVALRDMHQTLQVRRTVLVQPSCYGQDNAAMLYGIAQLGQEVARGVAVVNPDTVSEQTLEQLHQSGVRGIRLNSHVQGDALAQVQALIARTEARIQGLGWHIQLHVSAAMLPQLELVLLKSKVPIVLDHFGGGSAVTDAVSRLLATDHIWLKLSAPYRVSQVPGYADLQEAVQNYTEIAPQRLLWASDWPHTGGDGGRSQDPTQIEPFRPEDATTTLNTVARWLHTPSLIEQVLVHNPAQLYGF